MLRQARIALLAGLAGCADDGSETFTAAPPAVPPKPEEVRAQLVQLMTDGSEPKDAAGWWKGDLLPQDLWHGANAIPDTVLRWYRRNGYAFFVVQDDAAPQPGASSPAFAELPTADRHEGPLALRARYARDDEFALLDASFAAPILASDRFVEIYSTAPAGASPDAETRWDAENFARAERDESLLFGYALDDARSIGNYSDDGCLRGRGWVAVHCERLAPDDLRTALERGEFYASSGVRLASVDCDRETLRVAARRWRKGCASLDGSGSGGWSGTATHTQFIGARRHGSRVEVLLDTTQNPAEYRFEGDELFVRARVVSNVPTGSAGAFESAWTQPVRPR